MAAKPQPKPGTIRVNDEAVAWREGMTVREMLAACNYTFPLIIVTVDGVQVSRGEFDAVRIPEKAEVQVFHLMSGG